MGMGGGTGPITKPAKVKVVPSRVIEREAEGLMALFVTAGPDLFKQPEVKAKLKLTDINGFSVVSTLATSGVHSVQMALAHDEEILNMQNKFGTPISTILMHSGNNEVRLKIAETQAKAKLRK